MGGGGDDVVDEDDFVGAFSEQDHEAADAGYQRGRDVVDQHVGGQRAREFPAQVDDAFVVRNDFLELPVQSLVLLR